MAAQGIPMPAGECPFRDLGSILWTLGGFVPGHFYRPRPQLGGCLAGVQNCRRCGVGFMI